MIRFPVPERVVGISKFSTQPADNKSMQPHALHARRFCMLIANILRSLHECSCFIEFIKRVGEK